MENVTILLAFAGGFLAFISPCCLPLYPSFISYISGISVNQLKNQEDKYFKKIVFVHSVFFSLGFSIIYYILGFSLSGIGKLFIHYQHLIRMFGGIFLIVMGLFMVGLFQPKFMLKEMKFQYRKKNVSFLNSLFVGLFFAAGWTPCIGPIFSSIMYANVVNPTQTFFNVTAYSLGFCIPFIIMAFFISKTKVILKYSALLMKIGGAIIIVLGIMLYFDWMNYFNIWFSEIKYFIYDLFN
ncbi:cytochrome c biogenesis protein CcdA [Heyndrickxia sporothermodurans]|uniref:cytochrome c biogenesis CcdA family protein n=1 Tax=Heyndrickxia sporothermodurans TaxID=46224 RepID=UPI002DC026CE|nr:cytochrome c biogenesis protein CcdA [Heyndrickxia sporothermodurans]MEB6551137.1 cytochrome c biogenesis protein CcdA [Heyndrickxia sporothermodurans]